jgi:hypothetical protein
MMETRLSRYRYVAVELEEVMELQVTLEEEEVTDTL